MQVRDSLNVYYLLENNIETDSIRSCMQVYSHKSICLALFYFVHSICTKILKMTRNGGRKSRRDRLIYNVILDPYILVYVNGISIADLSQLKSI